MTGSYDPGFNLAGILISLSGIMLFAIPYMKTKPYNYTLATVTITAEDYDEDLLRELQPKPVAKKRRQSKKKNYLSGKNNTAQERQLLDVTHLDSAVKQQESGLDQEIV